MSDRRRRQGKSKERDRAPCLVAKIGYLHPRTLFRERRARRSSIKAVHSEHSVFCILTTSN